MIYLLIDSLIGYKKIIIMKKNKLIGFIGLSHLSLSYSLASVKKLSDNHV